MQRRIIIHSDLNSFYASVEGMKKPWLKNVPMAVAGDSEKRHGIILAKNIHAAKFGVKTAEPIWQAKSKCPELITVPPSHDDYIIISKQVRSIYEEYSNRIESFGIDECWLDITDIAKDFDEGRKIADEIRAEIRTRIGITASCGVSFNKTFAKLGSDLKKPDATTVIDDTNFKQTVWPLSVDKLLFVGNSTKKTLRFLGIHTVGELALADVGELERILGKHGVSLWINANGNDASPVTESAAPSSVKSVSNSITLSRDITADEDVRVVLLALCEKVSARMRKIDCVCDTVQIWIRDNEFNSYERQTKLPFPNRTAASLFEAAFDLYNVNHRRGRPIRALGVKAANISERDVGQMSIAAHSEDTLIRRERLESAADSIRSQFGKASIKRGIMLTDNILSDVNVDKNKIAFTKIDNQD